MRKPLSILLTLVLLFCVSCINENNRDDCYNARILFNYNADGEANVISDYIQSAKLLVYDDSGSLYTSLHVSKLTLASKEGLLIDLPKGRYSFVCWGNYDKYSQLTEEESIATSRIQATGYLDSSKIESNDHLYYGIETIEFKEGFNVTKVLDFSSAHINLEVAVKGFRVKPALHINNLMPQYDMYMRPTKEYSTSYWPTFEFNEGFKVYISRFQVLRFNNNNPLELVVEFPGLREPMSISIAEFMKSFNPILTVEDKQEVTLSILIELTDLGVVVSIPNWQIEPGIPNIQ